MTSQQVQQRPLVSTGVEGLDEVLGGGLPKSRLYLIYGGPGTGKTTLSFQFLRKGAELGERVMYVSLLLNRDELDDVMHSHNWTLDGIELAELPQEVREAAAAGQTVFSPAEVELGEVTGAIIEKIRHHEPKRVAIDSVSELNMLVDNSYQLRRQLLMLRHALREVGSTTYLICGESIVDQLPTLQTIVHGTIELDHRAPSYGMTRRRIRAVKVRGREYRSGFHHFRIRTGGLEVFPRLAPSGDTPSDDVTVIGSGNEQLDQLFGGGLRIGSTCLLMGTSGAGKSTLASCFVAAATNLDRRASVHCFDESVQTFLARSRALKLGIVKDVEEGSVDLHEHDIGELTAGSFTDDLRRDALERDVSVVVIDSFTGYLNAMPEEEQLVSRLHEMLTFFSYHGVLCILTQGLHGFAEVAPPDVDTSYLVDSVVLMRHFEALGQMRQCISVLKKRHGWHESTIRELEIREGGFGVGPPLRDFTGILTGTPTFEGNREELLDLQKDATT